MSYPQGQVVRPFGGNYDRLSIQFGDEAHVVERAMIRQIHQLIEEEIERQETMWLPRDKEYAQAMRIPFSQTRIERVLPNNYFVGARPSLVNTSIDFWPSITARAGDERASSEQADQFDINDIDLYVEVLCKAGPVAQDELQQQPGINAEGEVNRQVQRLSAAVHMCVRRDPTLGAIIEPIQRPPARRSSLPFAVPGSDGEGSGDYWVYAGKQLRYIVQANSF